MANSFKNSLHSGIGTTPTTVYTAPSSTQTTVIGFTISNITGGNVAVDVEVNSGGSSYYMVLGSTIEPGSALVPVGQMQKLVLRDGDYVVVTADTTSAVDVILSVLEIS